MFEAHHTPSGGKTANIWLGRVVKLKYILMRSWVLRGISVQGRGQGGWGSCPQYSSRWLQSLAPALVLAPTLSESVTVRLWGQTARQREPALLLLLFSAHYEYYVETGRQAAENIMIDDTQWSRNIIAVLTCWCHSAGSVKWNQWIKNIFLDKKY